MSEKESSVERLSVNALTTLKDVLIFNGMDLSSNEIETSVKNNLILMINAASSYIETQTGREFRKRERTERYAGTGSQKLVLNHYPVRIVSKIRDISSGEIDKDSYYLEDEGKNGIIYKDDGWPGYGFPSGLAGDVNQCHLLNENSDITSEFFFSTSNPNFFNYYLTNTSSCAAFF